MGLTITRSSAILAEWKAKIWESSTIKSITESIVYHDITEDTHKELSSIRHNQEINFFFFRVRRSMTPQMGGKYRVFFFADVVYTKYADPDGDTYVEVIDALETVQELVITDLGEQWGGLVGTSYPQEGPPVINPITIGDERAFKGEFSFEAYICIT